MARSQIIFLHGPSSSGKTTLARALQAALPDPFWHLSIDHFRDSGALPWARFSAGGLDWRNARGPVFDGFHHAVAAIAAAGNNVILEHILDTPGWDQDLRHLLAGHDVLFVGLKCSLNLLQSREVARGDRPLGSAARDFASVHEGRSYDLELDGSNPVPENVARVLDLWRSDRRGSVFFS